MSRPLRLLVWQVHGGWMDAFVRGRHTCLLPVDANGPVIGRIRPIFTVSCAKAVPAASVSASAPSMSVRRIIVFLLGGVGVRPSAAALPLALAE